MPTNSNNPVSAKLRSSLGASGMLLLRYPMRTKSLTIRIQFDLSLVGAAFSPEYGESYYEIFGLEDYGGTLRFSHPVNTPSWRHTLSADIPIGNSTIRVSYVADLYQTKVNNLRTHLYNHSFSVGFVRTIYKVKHNDPLNAYNPF